MNSILSFITWNPNIEFLSIGFITLRYYSILFVTGLVLAYLVVKHLYKDQKIADKLFEPLYIYAFVGILVGARLGHCLFYQPEYFLAHPLEIILPVQFTPEGMKFIGYQGLASHGGTIGLIIALWVYVRKTKLNYINVLDNIAIATPIAACFIRLGNLMNSEIIGQVTDVPWAFIFVREDLLPRHPAQLYEALGYLLFFFINIFLYSKFKNKLHRGFFFGLTITLIFAFRFFVEFLKEAQVSFEEGMTLDMGQWLSIPFVVLGIACMIGGKWLKRLSAPVLPLLVAMLLVSCATQSKEQQALSADDPSFVLSHWMIENEADTLITNVSEGIIEITSPQGLTLWYNKKLSGNYEISYRIVLIMEGGMYDRLGDLNCFWGASDPKHPDYLFERSVWRNGIFSHYNSLNLFYVGYGGNENSTTRFRQYHGQYFGQADSIVKPLLQEYTDDAHLLKANKWYHVVIKVSKEETTYTIDGETLFRLPLKEGEGDGYFGLRLLTNHVQIMEFGVKEE